MCRQTLIDVHIRLLVRFSNGKCCQRRNCTKTHAALAQIHSIQNLSRPRYIEDEVVATQRYILLHLMSTTTAILEQSHKTEFPPPPTSTTILKQFPKPRHLTPSSFHHPYTGYRSDNTCSACSTVSNTHLLLAKAPIDVHISKLRSAFC